MRKQSGVAVLVCSGLVASLAFVGEAFATTYVVLDIGSSGTRPYEITVEGCTFHGVEEGTKVEGGLAKDDVKDWEQKVTAVLNDPKTKKALGNPSYKSIAYATAGFRKEQNRSEKIIEMLKKGGFKDIQIPLPGKLEATFAYLASKSVNATQYPVAEMGGASAQLYVLEGTDKAQSANFGQDLSYDQYKQCLLKHQKAPNECLKEDAENVAKMTAKWPKVKGGDAYAQGALKFLLPQGQNTVTLAALKQTVTAGCTPTKFSDLRGCFGPAHAVNMMEALNITTLHRSEKEVDWPVGAAMYADGCRP